MSRTTILAVVCTLAGVLAADPTDCRGQTSGPNKAGNLSIMSWHIHYTTNTSGMKIFYEAFIKEFKERFPWYPGLMCPFGPNWANSAEFPYVCSLEGGYDLDAESVSFVQGHGPWSGPQRAFWFPPKYIDEAWAWAQENRFHTDVLRHPNSGCMHDDHSVRAHWVLENASFTPSLDILAFPCNVPGFGCKDSLWPNLEPCCGCPTDRKDDDPSNSCAFCVSDNGFIDNLEFACTDPPLQVTYDNIKYYNGKVSCGNLFLEGDIGGDTGVAPVVKYAGAEDGSWYTLIMVDPDANLANNGSWPDVKIAGDHAPVRHWVVGNLDATALRTGDFYAAFRVSDFVGPSPPYGSHRYGLFLFQQPKKLQFKRISGSIAAWDFKEFLGRWGLANKLVASNWHITQHTDPRAATVSTSLSQSVQLLV